jgi:hypothetical protein
MGFAGPLLVPALVGIVAVASGMPALAIAASLAPMSGSLATATVLFAALVGLTALIWATRARLLARAGIRRAPVWGCGFQRPGPRMQYTASSFAQPLVTQFRLLIANREALVAPSGYFPAVASYASDSGDPFLRALFVPTFRWLGRLAARLNVIQHGHIHIYVLYIAITLVALLVWVSL